MMHCRRSHDWSVGLDALFPTLFVTSKFLNVFRISKTLRRKMKSRSMSLRKSLRSGKKTTLTLTHLINWLLVLMSLPISLPPSAFPALALATLALPLSKRKLRSNNLFNNSQSDSTWNTAPHEPIYCRLCNGRTTIPCNVCNRTGFLSPGGFTRKNPVRVANLIGSKWTSVKAIGGKWRHFLCVEKKGRNARDGIAILSSTCGPVQKRVRIEVPVSELKRRDMWMGGWTTMVDLKDMDNVPGTRCSACKGEKEIVCPRCNGAGQAHF